MSFFNEIDDIAYVYVNIFNYFFNDSAVALLQLLLLDSHY